MASPPLRRLAAPSWVRPEMLNVAPDLLGMPLATPARRAGAIAVDFAVLALLSASGVSWIAAGIAALVFQLRRRQPAHGLRRNAWLWLALAVLVFLALDQAAGRVGRWVDARWAASSTAASAPATATASSPAAAAEIAEAGDDDDDDDRAAREAHRATAAAGSASGASAPTEAVLAARVARLEAELAQARKPAPQRWRDDLLKRLHRVGVGFGWAAFYFTLLPFAWQGRTVGKRLFGLRIVELTGRPLTLLTCFGRYGGYAAAMATGGVGFAQILWDSNRQAMQDKIAHTVVVDERAPPLRSAHTEARSA